MSFLLCAIMEFLTIINMTVIWEDDHLTIDLFEPIEEYVKEPSARLYDDDGELIDLYVHYERGVDRTFLSVVQTSHVHTYYIKYRVHFPTYGIKDTHTIVFDVVDRIAPVFHQVPSIRIPLGHALPDMTTGLAYDDNYDDLDDLELDIETHAVLNNRVGVYPVTYRVRDRSGNEAVFETTVDVYDHLAPTIDVKKPIELPYGTLFRFEDYLTIEDNHDVVLSIEIDDDAVDYEKTGSYPLIVSATDRSGLKTTVELVMHIIDLEPPDIRLIGYRPTITVFDKPEREQLLEYVIAVRDNYDGVLDPKNLLVETDLDTDVTGRYEVHYAIRDTSGNVRNVSIEVDVVDDVKPKIVIQGDLSFPVGDPKPFLNERIVATDNYSDNDELEIEFETTFDMEVIGQYPLTVTATDEAGNMARMMIYIEIHDSIDPVIDQIQDIVVTDFAPKNVEPYFVVSDNYTVSDDLAITVDDSEVEYERTGLYSLDVCTYDESGNHACLQTYVLVVDVVDPVLTLTRDKIYFPIGNRPFDFLDFVEDVSDNYDTLTLDDILCRGTIDFDHVGRYPITYDVADSSGNRTVVTLDVYVDRYDPPIIDIEPVRSIGQYESFDPLEAIGTLAEGYTVDFFPSRIDSSTPGIKTITYVMTDDRGNSTLVTQDIRVVEKKEALTLQAFFPLIVINSLGLASFLHVRKKTRSF